MNITISKFKKVNEYGKIKAFIDIILGDKILIKGLRIVEGKNNLFVAFPSDKNKEGKYIENIDILDLELKQNIEKQILELYKSDE